MKRYYGLLGEYADHIASARRRDRGHGAAIRARASTSAGCDELFMFPAAKDPAQVDLLAEAVQPARAGIGISRAPGPAARAAFAARERRARAAAPSKPASTPVGARVPQPFGPLVLAAAALETERVELGTGIAWAFGAFPAADRGERPRPRRDVGRALRAGPRHRHAANEHRLAGRSRGEARDASARDRRGGAGRVGRRRGGRGATTRAS